MEKLQVFKKILQTKKDDDRIDRINHSVTFYVLMIVVIITACQEMGGSRLVCIVPPEMRMNDEYISSLCYVKGTFYIPFEADLDTEKRLHINYFPWISFIITAFAFLYQIPFLYWKSWNNRNSIGVTSITELFEKAGQVDSLKKRDYLKEIAKYFGGLIKVRDKTVEPSRSRVATIFLQILGIREGDENGDYLIVIYLTTKTLYLLNVVLQLFFIYIVFGVQSNGKMIDFSKYFKRFVFCQFSIRELGNERFGLKHTIQCLSPPTYFLRIISVCYWFWLLVLLVVNTVNFAKWGRILLNKEAQVKYISKHVMLDQLEITRNDELLRKFTVKYLKPDMVFMARLLSHNFNDIYITRIITLLYVNSDIENY